MISKWILITMVACISYSAWAFGEDDKKATQKNSSLKIANKKNSTPSKKDQEDTLVYDKTSINDTLTFDDKKSLDDTLIFADDEMNLGGKTETKNNQDFSVNDSEKRAELTSLIYPNPSFGHSTLEINTPENSNTEITINSEDGTLIKKENTTHNSYELTHLAAGTYIVTIRNGNQIIQKRLFVK